MDDNLGEEGSSNALLTLEANLYLKLSAAIRPSGI